MDAPVKTHLISAASDNDVRSFAFIEDHVIMRLYG